MKDNRNIEELFKEGLKDFEAPVDPSVWNSIQSNLANGVGASASGGVAGMSVGKIVAIGAIAVSAIGTIAYFAVGDEKGPETKPAKESIVVNNETNEEASNSKVDVSEDVQADSEHETTKTEFVEIEVNQGNTAVDNAESDQVGLDTSDGDNVLNNSNTNSGSELDDSNQNTDDGAESDDTASENVQDDNVNDAIDPELTIILSETEIEEGGSVEFRAKATAGTILWEIKDEEGSVIGTHEGESGSTPILDQEGKYLVHATLTDDRGVSVSNMMMVEVYSKKSITSFEIASDIHQDNEGVYHIDKRSGKGLRYEFVSGTIEDFSIAVVNGRNGQTVFTSTNPEIIWDGTDNSWDGSMITMRYFVIIFYTDISTQKQVKKPVTVDIHY